MSSPITTIAEIGKHDGQSVTLRGWLYNLRESGKLLFPQFRDGSGVIQGVVPKNAVTPEVFEAIKTLTQESSVIVEGKVRADKRAPGGYELDVQNVRVVQRVPESDPYPITPKEHGTEFLKWNTAICGCGRSGRLRFCACARRLWKAVRDFFDERGFTLTDPPILTPAACEGTSTLFPVDYFDEQAYLTQSGQLYIEATAMALGKVYSFGPTFRAEKSKTRRHLTEFWMVEPEIAYGELDDLMDLAEGLISFVVKRCLEQRRTDLQAIGRDISKLEKIEPPFPRISYDDAVKNLQEGHAKGGAGSEIRVGRRSWLSRRNVSFGAIRQARDGASLSGEGKGVLTWNPIRSALILALCVDVLAPEGYGRNHRWIAAYGLTRVVAAAHSTSTDCRRKRSGGIWICASSGRFRMAALAWESSAAWPGSAGLSMCGKRFPSRGCYTDCTFRQLSHWAIESLSDLETYVFPASVFNRKIAHRKIAKSYDDNKHDQHFSQEDSRDRCSA